ncbi:hypothetical protein A1O7_00682 [Cladophialophora yegresii CBS 114405]|uniref:Uncharacterized protein n=1 Tax=Cladophialophora yegresii CBS 114405 TaxID=1182544 RepID=W9WID5_9EURO|nr:uncharacterized protein A1O7_00682 [Cladophialophora yegresii CBS 114405]EXJ64346.1 hypothetical protein A1O7_00682 [Cladophialophora yegresii CBS 114405]
MLVEEPPVCPRCADEAASVAKLEQHVRRPSKNSGGARNPKTLLDGTSERVSLADPLNPDANKIGRSRNGQRMPPVWMALLPSNRASIPTPAEGPGPPTKMVPSARDCTAPSTPFVTPPHSPKTRHRDSFLRTPPLVSIKDMATRTPQASPDSIMTHQMHTIEETSVGSSDQEGLDITASKQSSISQSPNSLTRASSGSKASQPGAINRIRRSFSISRGINNLRRSSTTKSVADPTGSRGLPESRTSTPAIDVAPEKSAFLKELSDFFLPRAKKGKMILPSRVGGGHSSTKIHECPPSTPGTSGLETSCGRCGVDTSDWWVRRESIVHSQDDHRGHGDRTCESCKAAETMPGTMPGGWD